MENLILLDCDGVIIDFNRLFLEHANMQFDVNLKFEDITDFNYRKCLGEEIGTFLLRTLWLNPTLYDGYAFAPEVIDGIAELRKLGRVVIASSTFPEHATSKMQFLIRNGIPWNDILLIHDKTLIERTPRPLLIDDGSHNLDFHRGPKIVFDKPWNQSWNELGYDDALRAHTWPHIVVAAQTLLSE